jgi:hypothetical protein
MSEETLVQEQPIIQTPSQNDVVDAAIQRIVNNENKFYIYCPPMNIASGGVSVLFKDAQLLKEAGKNVIIVYEPRLDQKASYEASVKNVKNKTRIDIFEVFNTSWLGSLAEGLDIRPLGEGKNADDLKFNDGTIKTSFQLVLSPDDFFFIPEGFPNIMEKTAQMPCKRIIIAQSWYYILNSLQSHQTWQHFGINDVISVSDGITEYLNAIMPGLKIKQYSQSIDRKLFKPTDITKKSPVVVFSPGRTQDAVIKTYNVIKTFYSFYKHLSWIRFSELKGLSKEDYAERIGEAALCLYTDEIAGFGTMPLEAMAMGTHVAGWTPLGGKEYMKQNNGFWAQNGDIFQLAELLGVAIEKWLLGKLDEPIVMEEYEQTLSQYTEDKEKTDFINIINTYTNQRIEEFNAIKL